MQDEHFIQGWTESHTRFSADFDRGLAVLARRFAKREGRADGIRNPYGIPAELDGRHTLSPAAKASLRGIAASVLTAALWVVVMALATPTPGFAATVMTPVASVECLAHPMVA